jgi:aspartyl-tRNA(Asn)/glutamyl-tRNA(Gln) amidotransferase subunit C
MISDETIKKLLSLARIEVSDEEKEKLRQDVENILGYVGEIEKAAVQIDSTPKAGELKNVMREDKEPHESGLYSEKILREAPERKDDYISVKKIL